MKPYQRQNIKRRGLPRIPSGFLDLSEYVLLLWLAKRYGSKKAAIVAGLRALQNQTIIEDQQKGQSRRGVAVNHSPGRRED